MPISGVAPPKLQHADIARRIPHQYSMCLLDRVTAWDQQQISGEADSHHSLNNPMRAHGRLGVSCGIEYAAQAMALHGALLGEAGAVGGSPARGGYLVSVRSVTLFVEQLDTIVGLLTVNAERVSGDTTTVLYNFTVLDGMRILLSGRAIVVLDPPTGMTGAIAARIAA